jgi:hypothetical protein
MYVTSFHSTACRRSTGSLVFVTLFPKDKIQVTGELNAIDPKTKGFFVGYPPNDKVGPVKDIIDNKTKLFQPCGFSIRKSCAKCSAQILNDHGEIIDVNGGIWNWEDEDGFAPEFHLNYESAILKFKDGLPKYKDFPAEFGGSDEKIGE